MTNPFSAGESALGYFYQIRLALYLLISVGKHRPNIEITIEGLDDISFEQGGSAVELIQAKFHLNTTASLTDRSSDLWKTLRVWSHHIKEGNIQPDETLFSIITTATAPADSVASLLRPDRNRDNEKAIELLELVATETSNESNRVAYETFSLLTPRQRSALIANIQVLDASSSITDVRAQILSELQLVTRPQFLTAVCERIEGWWFDRVLKHLTGEYEGSVLYQEVRDHIHSIQEQFHEDSLPIDFSNTPEMSESELSEEELIFVEQLKLIMVSEPHIQKAITDYYRAYHQRSKWAREDLLLVGELDDYEAKLIDEWQRRFLIMQEDIGSTPTEEQMQREGRALFRWTEMDLPGNPRMFIRPRCTEPYIIRGSYHLLANRLKVGWHADFINRLRHLIADAQGAQQ